MYGWLLAEGCLELAGIGGGDLPRVECAQTLADLERPRERRLHRYLLVEREADEERERVGRDQPVGRVVAAEVEAVGHD